MNNNYFFVDGSVLLADVRKARIDLAIPETSLFSLERFAKFFTGLSFRQFHGGSYRRFVFYFVKDDSRLRLFKIPDFTKPGAVSDLRVEYCGKRIQQFQQARTWLEDKLCAGVRSRMSLSE